MSPLLLKADLDAVDTLSTDKIMDTLPKLKEGGVKLYNILGWRASY